MRAHRTTETYELRCAWCQSLIEIAAAAVQSNIGTCPRCGSGLRIEWMEGRDSI
jgi:rRNA maturation endonuclease Nob1